MSAGEQRLTLGSFLAGEGVQIDRRVEIPAFFLGLGSFGLDERIPVKLRVPWICGQRHESMVVDTLPVGVRGGSSVAQTVAKSTPRVPTGVDRWGPESSAPKPYFAWSGLHGKEKVVSSILTGGDCRG